MLKHSDVWRAIDALAVDHGFSPSGLARRAGLDPTTFNKSKRITAEGKKRWPSTESIAKILHATGASLGEFLSHIGDGEGIGIFRNVPLIGLAQPETKDFLMMRDTRLAVRGMKSLSPALPTIMPTPWK